MQSLTPSTPGYSQVLNVPGTFRQKNKTLTKLLTNGITKVPTGYELPGFFFLKDFGEIPFVSSFVSVIFFRRKVPGTFNS